MTAMIEKMEKMHDDVTSGRKCYGDCCHQCLNPELYTGVRCSSCDGCGPELSEDGLCDGCENDLFSVGDGQ